MTRLVLALLLVTLVAPAALADAVHITRADDPSPVPSHCLAPDDVDCSLRGAVNVVESNPGVDRRIDVPAGTYPLTQGPLRLSDGVALVGAGAASTTIDALGADRVILIAAGATIDVAAVTLTRGSTGPAKNGAAILNLGDLTLTDAVVRDSVSEGHGGGVSNMKDVGLGAQGVLTIVGTAFLDNKAALGGGAIYNDGGTVDASDCLLDGNQAFLVIGTALFSGVGGGLSNFGTATLTRCTLHANAGGGAGGGAVAGVAGSVTTLVDTTLSGNAATLNADSRGGGVWTKGGGAVELRSVTVTGNTSSAAGAGIYTPDGDVSGQNTIVAGNEIAGGPPSDCSGTLASTGYNLLGDAAGCVLSGGPSDLVGVDPLLGPLADHGGPTATHALLPGSPAIDAANPATPGSAATACSVTDQRGVPRPQGARCDIGAFELVPPTTTTSVTVPSTSSTSTSSTSTSSTTTTSLPLPSPVEVCDDCIDNDGDGLTDLEDPACCAAAAPLALRSLRLATKKTGGTTLALGGTLAASTSGAGAPTTADVFVQLRAEGASDFLCARIPAARLARRGKKLVFADRTHDVASARGIEALTLKAKKTGLAVRVGGGLGIVLPPAGTVHVTVGLRDPADAEAGNRCAAVAARLAAKKRGLALP